MAKDNICYLSTKEVQTMTLQDLTSSLNGLASALHVLYAVGESSEPLMVEMAVTCEVLSDYVLNLINDITDNGLIVDS